MPKPKSPAQADRADRHRLYELAVQCPEAEIDFVDQTFYELRDRPAQTLREDFCGTATVCAEWVRRQPGNRAVGIDLDGEVLAWGRANNLAKLSKAERKNVELRQANVLDTDPAERFDIVSAMNFSYWLLKERTDLKRYFELARASLVDDGILCLDAFGGYDSFREIEEEREIDEDGLQFTYIWEHAQFDPVSNGLICHIHFEFPDGSRLERAFSYDWRHWTLPEIRELLQEAGFRRVTVYWQGWDEDGEPDGNFQPVTKGVAEAGWICYLVAER